jgi:hypothetical protein
MALVEVSSEFGVEDHEVIAVSALSAAVQWRADGVDRERVTALARSVLSFAPIVVNRRDMSVVDGAHRLAAIRGLGLTTVRVEWFDGTPAEAFAEFESRNSRAGTPPSGEDRRLGALRVLADQPLWSDRRIAHVCGVSPKLVARLRCDGPVAPAAAAREKRVGRDGRARPLKPGAIRGDIAKAIRESPCASLRMIAAELGVSPETVRSVRSELALCTEPTDDHAARAADVEVMTIERFTAMRRQRVEPRPWRDGHAFGSTEQGSTFVEWFEATTITQGCGRVDEVPLSRVYEIADEARQRARFWTQFADSLERRPRGRR